MAAPEIRRRPFARAFVRICWGASAAGRRVAVRRVLEDGTGAIIVLGGVRGGEPLGEVDLTGDGQGVALPGQQILCRLDATGGLTYEDKRSHTVELRANDADGIPRLHQLWVWSAAHDRHFAMNVCACHGCLERSPPPPAPPSPPPAPRRRKRPHHADAEADTAAPEPRPRGAKARLFREVLKRSRLA